MSRVRVTEDRALRRSPVYAGGDVAGHAAVRSPDTLLWLLYQLLRLDTLMRMRIAVEDASALLDGLPHVWLDMQLGVLPRNDLGFAWFLCFVTVFCNSDGS